MTTARAAAGGAVVASADASAHRMLVVGGVDSSRRYLDSCELYDAVADRWSMQEARLPQAICFRAVSITSGSAVLAVQSYVEKNTRCALLDVRCSSSRWQAIASAPIPRTWHAVAAVGEYSAVMLGGLAAKMSRTDTAQLYDVRADRWSQRAEWRLSARSSEHCAAFVE